MIKFSMKTAFALQTFEIAEVKGRLHHNSDNSDFIANTRFLDKAQSFYTGGAQSTLRCLHLLKTKSKKYLH